jgi:hypothetical protein
MDSYNAEFDQEMLEQQRYESEINIDPIEPKINDNYKQIICEDNAKLLHLFALQQLLDETSKVIDEIKNEVKLSYKTLDLVNEEKSVEFESGLKFEDTQPKQKTLKDYDNDIEKACKSLKLAQEKKIDFEQHGCEENKSKASLTFGTTNSKFKESVAIKKAKILQEMPIFNQIKAQIKQIEN